ncbi:DUF423 domain-containing protein [Thalassotalea sediminis]|uniref:DUF423 domain-containing protein n=1 Tax=Thalassotalea sediminis TaxID=1759089 RepID=UPI00257224C7|nr:DUF423 domain-containing protein [Thalassotalea sediminis]
MNNIENFFKVFVGLSGAYSVLFGAWLSHQGHTLPVEVVSTLKDAHFYQFIHTVALFAICMSKQNKHTKAMLVTASLLAFGILCFSGSLYIKTFFDWQAIGKLAPIGGISLSLAWLSVLIHLNIRKH